MRQHLSGGLNIIVMTNTGFAKQARGMSMNMNMSMKGPAKMSNMSAPMCTTKTLPVADTSLNKTYTVPKGFSGNPATANGKCIVDNSMETPYWTLAAAGKTPCTISNGIIIAGHCESVTKGYEVIVNGPANLTTEEWFQLAGTTLKPGEFLDMVDTTPFVTRHHKYKQTNSSFNRKKHIYIVACRRIFEQSWLITIHDLSNAAAVWTKLPRF